MSWVRKTEATRFLPRVLLAGFALRLGWALLAPVQPISDFLWYFERATALAAGRGYVLADGTPTAYFPVGYPAFLGGLFHVFGPSVVAAKLANVILSTLTIGIVYALFGRLLARGAPAGSENDERIRRWATVLFACFPSQIVYVALVSDSILFQCLLYAGLLLLLLPRWRAVMAGGVVLGLAALTRPYVLFVPVVVGALLIGRQRGRGVLRRTAVATLLMLLVIAPWTVRNAARFDAFVPVSTNGGINLLIGNGSGATGGYRGGVLAALERSNAIPAASSNREVARDCAAGERALEAITSEPLRILRLVPRKLFHEYGDDAHALRWNLKGLPRWEASATYSPLELGAMVVFQLYYVLVLVAAAAYLILAIARRRRRVGGWGLVLGLLVYFTAIAVVFFGDPRYHFPLTPLFCFYAASAGVLWAGSTRRKRSPR